MMSLRALLSVFVVVAFTLPVYGFGSSSDDDELKGKAKQELATAKKLIDEKEYKKAMGHLKKARKADNKNADIHNYLGYSYRKLGAYENSMLSYDKALALDPDHKGTLEYKGELYLKLGEPEKAAELEDQLKELCPDGCEELEDLENAIANYEPKGR
jgi:tetratricopeptide (TPR) repeat protein